MNSYVTKLKLKDVEYHILYILTCKQSKKHNIVNLSLYYFKNKLLILQNNV